MSHISISQTTFREFCATHTWRIENLSLSDQSNGYYLQGTKFDNGLNDGVKWSIKLFPNGFAPTDSGFMTLQLFYHSSLKVDARIFIQIHRIENQKIKVEIGPYRFNKEVKVLEISRFLSHDALYNKRYGLLSNGIFNITIKAFYIFKKEPLKFNNGNVWKYCNGTFPATNLYLLKSGDFSDVSILVHGETLKAHKFILMSKSPVFEAMFNKIEEKQILFTIDDDDFDAYTVKSMLEFIYTDNITDNEVNPLLLLDLAKKYQIKDMIDFASNIINA
uniref:BTB domain-containing protein n=1 Tax=Panagrolaimus sp. ES5 TaxID=591445 RepID=A0AC34F3M7_9BILA